MKEDYSNNEIDGFLREMDNRTQMAHANFQQSLDRIEKQTVKTNGRVTSLEQWKAYMAGAIAVITVLIIPVLLLIVRYVLTK